jgi:hypothetical protein
MSDTTDRLDLPYPELGDEADIEDALVPLAEALDGLVSPILLGLANDRPTAGVPRRGYFGTDDKRLWIDDGTQWILAEARGTAGGDLTGSYPNPTITAGAVDAGKIAASLKPSGSAGASTEALRALGTAAGQAAAGAHASQHAYAGADPVMLTDLRQLPDAFLNAPRQIVSLSRFDGVGLQTTGGLITLEGSYFVVNAPAAATGLTRQFRAVMAGRMVGAGVGSLTARWGQASTVSVSQGSMTEGFFVATGSWVTLNPSAGMTGAVEYVANQAGASITFFLSQFAIEMRYVRT